MSRKAATALKFSGIPVAEGSHLTTTAPEEAPIDLLVALGMDMSLWFEEFKICRYTQSDRSNNPGFVFVPVEPQYFIEFELRDQAQRVQSYRLLGRQMPTSRNYAAHLEGYGPPSHSSGHTAQ
ncbi:hypothetical protein N7490_011156 [Penicillium lividum]|nr:hypothetical protein N7490_011156 [Penicillium lividum]